MTYELERLWVEVVVDDLRYYLRLCLKEVTETSRIFRQFSRSSDRYLNPGPSDYEAVCYQLGHYIRGYCECVKICIGESLIRIYTASLLETFLTYTCHLHT